MLYVVPNRYEKLNQIATGNIVTVDEVKAMARMDLESEFLDDTIEGFIKSAISRVEAYTGLILLRTRLRAWYDGLPMVMKLNKQPNLEVEGLFVNGMGFGGYEVQTMETFTNIILEGRGEPDQADSVYADILVGWESVSDIPQEIKTAIANMAVKMLTGDCGDNLILTKGAKDLLRPFRNEAQWMEIQ